MITRKTIISYLLCLCTLLQPALIAFAVPTAVTVSDKAAETVEAIPTADLSQDTSLVGDEIKSWKFENDLENWTSSGVWSASHQDGNLVATRTDTQSSGGSFSTPAFSVAVEDAKYIKLRVKTTGLGWLNVYFTREGDSGLSEDRKLRITLDATNTDYQDIVYEVNNSNWTGNIAKFSINASSAGTVYLDEISICNKKAIEYSMYITASSNSITEPDGIVTITPTVSSNSTEIPLTVSYATSNSNVQATKNADGTLTLVGKNNGDVTVTAYSDYDKSIKDIITISVSGQTAKKAYYDANVFMMGNSIIKHGYAPQTGWDGDGYGMAATKKENDYVHRLMQHYMVEKYGELDFVAYNYSQFERDIKNELNVDYESSGFTGLKLLEAQMKSLPTPPEIVTVQGGENATYTVSAEAFKEAYLQLFEVIKRNSAPNVQIVVTTVFWPNDAKISGIHAAAEEAGVRCADIYVLGNDDENKAYDDYKGSCNGHPGDLGMDRIAQYIYEELNVTLTENLQPTDYVFIPEAIEITANKAQITQNLGTLNLSVNATPSNAGTAVKWSVDNENIATIDVNGVLTAKNNGTVTVTAVSRFDANVTDTFEVVISRQTPCYTITYASGTTDEVTKLPEVFDYAKGDFALSMSAPERKYYIFEGWTLEEGSAELVESIDATKDTTVYACWRPAESWDFNIDGYQEGVVAENGFNVQVQKSAMLAYATETNLETGEVLRFVSPELNVSAADMAGFKLTMTNSTIEDGGYVTFELQTTNGNHTFTKEITSTNATTYIFDFVGEDVTGTITGFTITPTQIDSAVLIDKMFFVPELAFNLTYDANTTDEVTELPAVEPILSNRHTVSVTGPKRAGYRFVGWAARPDSIMPISILTERKDTTLYAIWDSNTHWDFSTSSEVNSQYTAPDGVIFNDGTVYHDATTVSDPKFQMRFEFSVDATKHKNIEYRIKKTSADGDTWYPTTFYWTTNFSTTTDETKKVAENDVSKCGTELTTVNVDLSKNADWKDTITSFRVDPIPKYGTYEIDYVRFTDSDDESLFVISDGMTEYLSRIPYSNILLNGGTLVVDTNKTISDFAYAKGDIVHNLGAITVTETAQFTGSMDNLPKYIKAEESATVYLNDELFVPREIDNYAALYGVKGFLEDYTDAMSWNNTDNTVTTQVVNGKVVVTNTVKESKNYNLFNGDKVSFTFKPNNVYTMFIDVTDITDNSTVNESDALTVNKLRFGLDNGAYLSSKVTNAGTGSIDNFGSGTVKHFTVDAELTNNSWYLGFVQRAGSVTVDNFGLYYKPSAKESAVVPVYDIKNNLVSITYPNGIYDETLYAITQNPSVIDGVINVDIQDNTVIYEIEAGIDVVIPSLVNASLSATYDEMTVRIPTVDENALKYGAKLFLEENVGELTFTAWQNRVIYDSANMEFKPDNNYVFVIDLNSGDQTKLQPTFGGAAITNFKDPTGTTAIFSMPNGHFFSDGKIEFTVTSRFVASDNTTHNQGAKSNIQICSNVAGTYDINNFGVYYKPTAKDTVGYFVYNNDGTVSITYPNGIDEAALNAILLAPVYVGATSAKYENNVLTLGTGEATIAVPELVNAQGTATYPAFSVSPKTSEEASIRVSDPSGLRFMASLSQSQSAKAYEYGFIVTREDFLTAKGVELTHENAVNNGFVIVEGKAFSSDPANPKAPVIFDQINEEIIISGVVTNIPEEGYEKKLTCRPYILAGGSYYYGEAVTRSIKEIAVELVNSGVADTMGDEYKVFIYNAAGKVLS